MSKTYDVGIHLLATNGVSGVLAVIGKDLFKLGGSVGALEKQFKGLKIGIYGAFSMAAGAGVLKGLADIAKHGEKLLDQQNQLLRLGIKQNEILQATAGYWKNVAKAVPTSTVSEYLATVKELRAVTGSMSSAQKFAPGALKLDALLGNISGHEVHGELYKLLRAGEMKGIATDPKKLSELLGMSYSMIASFGGKLTPRMIQNLATRGGTAWMNADLKKSFGPMAVLAAEMGTGGSSSSSPGVVLYQLQQMMMGAQVLNKQQVSTYQKLGLLDMSKTQKTGFGGSQLQLEPGAIKGSLQYAGNVPGWAKDVVWPALVKASHGDPALLQNLLAKIAPTVNKAKAIELFGNPDFLKQQEKDLGMAARVMPMGSAYSSFTGKNPMGAISAFHQQYESMMEAIGAPAMQAAVPVMKQVTSLFTSIGKLSAAHGDAIGRLAIGLGTLSAVMVSAGFVALLAALSPVGALVVGLGTLFSVLVMFKDKLQPVADGIRTAFNTMMQTFNSVWKQTMKVVTFFTNAIARMDAAFSHIPANMGRAFGNLFHHMSYEVPGGGGGSWHGSSGASLGGHSSGGAPYHGAVGSGLYGAIINSEGTALHGNPYDASVGYFNAPSPLHLMTNNQSLAWGRRLRQLYFAKTGTLSSAKGAFQFENGTQREAMAALGLKGSDIFSAHEQREMAGWLARHRGLNQWEGLKIHPEFRAQASRALHVHTAVNVDGRKLAQATSKHIAKLHAHPRQAPTFDGTGYSRPGDLQLYGA